MDPATMPIDTGNTAFMLVCCSLVMLVTPGLAFSMAVWWGARTCWPS